MESLLPQRKEKEVAKYDSIASFQLWPITYLVIDIEFPKCSVQMIYVFALQDTEIDKNKGTPPPTEAATDQTDTQQKGDQNMSATPSKPGGKGGKQGSQASDNPKEDYIHIRARRGQATNSHSLAERVRLLIRFK